MLTIASVISELKKTKPEWQFSDKSLEEDEHCLEMHLPYAKLIGHENCTLVPIMVGELDSKGLEAYANALQPYFEQEDSVFLISSDFCHWGKRFDYQPYNKQDGEIWESIKKLDSEGMEKIETQSVR